MKRWLAVAVVLVVLLGTVGVSAAPKVFSAPSRSVAADREDAGEGARGPRDVETAGLIRPKGIW